MADSVSKTAALSSPPTKKAKSSAAGGGDDVFDVVRVNACSSVGLACRLGSTEWLKQLLAAGAPTDVRDNRGWTAVHEAAYSNHVDCLRLVLGSFVLCPLLFSPGPQAEAKSTTRGCVRKFVSPPPPLSRSRGELEG